MMLRVTSWPMGFILVAKGKRAAFFWSELASTLVYVGLIWLGVATYGLKGAGMAFFGNYVIYWVGIYLIVRRLSGFRWSTANLRLAAIFLPATAAVFFSWYILSHIAAAILGMTLTLLTGIYSLRTLCALVPLERFPKLVQKIILFFRLAPPNTNG
jgi:PST family polysaccharide transporter